MYLTADKVINALIKAQQVLARPEIYGGDLTKIPISIDQLKDTISSMTGYTVEARRVSFEGTFIFGRCEKYIGSRAVIDIKHDLSEDWVRFVTAKELLHLLIDGDEDMSPYGDETLEKLVREGHIGIISQNGAQPPAQSELIAEVAAIELLYPIQLRLKDLSESSGQPMNQTRLALKYGIPVNFVDTAFSNDYLSVIKQATAEHLGGGAG